METKARKGGLQICANKTKLTELINSGEDPEENKGLMFEKVDDFKYLGATLSTKNNWAK